MTIDAKLVISFIKLLTQHNNKVFM